MWGKFMDKPYVILIGSASGIGKSTVFSEMEIY